MNPYFKAYENVKKRKRKKSTILCYCSRTRKGGVFMGIAIVFTAAVIAAVVDIGIVNVAINVATNIAIAGRFSCAL